MSLQLFFNFFFSLVDGYNDLVELGLLLESMGQT